MIKSLHDILEGRGVVSTVPHVTVHEACEILNDNNVGALAVLEDGALVGIISERDVVRRCIAAGRDSRDMTVGEAMTRDPMVLHCQASLTEALSVMIEGGFRHLPVVASDLEIVGMVSLRDIPTEYRLMVERGWGDGASGSQAVA